MKNRYYLMRHAHSVANEQGIITSKPSACTVAYGLTQKGEAQARTAAEELKLSLSKTPVVICSDFLRAYQTAKIVAAEFEIEAKTDVRLRERDFGKLHGESDKYYPEIWKVTDKDSTAKPKGVESDEEVLHRLNTLIKDLDRQYTDRDIVLVSHGDPLNILYAQHTFGDTTKQTHGFANAEIRPLLTLAPSVTIES